MVKKTTIAPERPLVQELRKKAIDAIVGHYPMMSSSEDFSQQKQEEIDLEERKRS